MAPLHLPTFPSLWSVFGSAMMAWTATMASLILVWSSLSSSMCSRRKIWAASFRVASGKRRFYVFRTAWSCVGKLDLIWSFSPPVSNPKMCLSKATGIPCNMYKDVRGCHLACDSWLQSSLFTSVFWLAFAIASGESLSWIRIRMAWDDNKTTIINSIIRKTSWFIKKKGLLSQQPWA